MYEQQAISEQEFTGKETGQKYVAKVFYDDCTSGYDEDFYQHLMSPHYEESRLGTTLNDHYSDWHSWDESALNYGFTPKPEPLTSWLRSWNYATDDYAKFGFKLDKVNIRQYMYAAFNTHLKPMLNEFLTAEMPEDEAEAVELMENLSYYDLCAESEEDLESTKAKLQNLYDEALKADTDMKAAACLDEVAQALYLMDDFTDGLFDTPNPAIGERVLAVGRDLWFDNPNVHLVGLYEHSGMCLTRGSGHCRWDNTAGAAMIVCAEEHFDSHFKYLDSIVRGEAYSLHVYELDEEGEETETDSCYGFIGYDPEELVYEAPAYFRMN